MKNANAALMSICSVIYFVLPQRTRAGVLVLICRKKTVLAAASYLTNECRTIVEGKMSLSL